MANNDSELTNAVVQAALTQGSKESSPRIYKENETDTDQPQPPNVAETSVLPSGSALNDTRAPEPMTLPERHQAAIRHIRTLEGHNTKLYEDNCRLVNAVNMLNDRLAFFGAPQNAQVLRLADLQEKLRTSEANRALINRKYQELLQCISAGSAQHHIGEELQAIREAYASLDKEYRLLGDKYVRLRAVADASRVAQQQSQGTVRPFFPGGRPEFANTVQFRTPDQSRNNYASPSSVISPGFPQPFLNQRGNHRQRSSEGVMAQSLRSGPTPIATTWLAPLPTPPPSAPLPVNQISPTGLLPHAPAPAGSIPLAHHPQVIHDPHALPGMPVSTQSQRLMQQGASAKLNATMMTDITTSELGSGKQTTAPTLLRSSPVQSKRPNTELQAFTTPEREHKKPRVEGESDHPTTINADTCPADKLLSPPASIDHDSDRKLSVPDVGVRSPEDCVDLIFEKDADVENGVFCGLCLDRYEAKMITEPPDILVQPDFDSLVRHCINMHPTVWEDLRRKA